MHVVKLGRFPNLEGYLRLRIGLYIMNFDHVYRNILNKEMQYLEIKLDKFFT